MRRDASLFKRCDVDSRSGWDVNWDLGVDLSMSTVADCHRLICITERLVPKALAETADLVYKGGADNPVAG